MTEQLFTKIADYGLSATIIALLFFMIWKFLPQFIEVQKNLSVSIFKFSESVEENTKITRKQYEKTFSIVDELKEVKLRLERHEDNAHEIKECQDEILRLLTEMKNKLEEV